MYNLLLLVVMSNISISPNTDMWNVVYRLYIIILYYVIVMIIHICSYSCFIVDVLLTSMFWFGSIDNTLCVLLSMLCYNEYSHQSFFYITERGGSTRNALFFYTKYIWKRIRDLSLSGTYIVGQVITCYQTNTFIKHDIIIPITFTSSLTNQIVTNSVSYRRWEWDSQNLILNIIIYIYNSSNNKKTYP